MKTTGNNKLSNEQVSTYKEKMDKIKEKTGNQYKDLIALVSGCLKKKSYIPYQEYKLFNRIYAEILEQEFNNKKVNNKSAKPKEVPTVDKEIDIQVICSWVKKNINGKSDIPKFNTLVDALTEVKGRF